MSMHFRTSLICLFGLLYLSIHQRTQCFQVFYWYFLSLVLNVFLYEGMMLHFKATTLTQVVLVSKQAVPKERKKC